MRFSLRFPSTIVIVLVLAGPAGCGSSIEPACVAGSTQACLCVGGGTGVQSCKDDGSGFGACDCGGDTGPMDAAVDSAVDSSVPDALADTNVSETTGETDADAATDGGVETASDSGTGKFTGATGTSWELRKGGINSSQGFSEYSPAGTPYFFAAYASGGSTGGGSPVMARYDISSDSWTTLAANPWGVENNKGLAWVGTSLFQAKDSFLYRYSIASNTWTSVASGMPGTFSSMHARDDANRVYSMVSDGTNRLVFFDTVTSALSYVAGPSGTVYHPRLAWDGNTKALYIAPNADEKLLWSYVPATGAVTVRASIPETSVGRAFCSDRAGHIYATGDNFSCSTSNSIWQYDTAANSWKVIPDLPFVHGCIGACTVTDDGWLFVSNGRGDLARLKLL